MGHMQFFAIVEDNVKAMTLCAQLSQSSGICRFKLRHLVRRYHIEIGIAPEFLNLISSELITEASLIWKCVLYCLQHIRLGW